MKILLLNMLLVAFAVVHAQDDAQAPPLPPGVADVSVPHCFLFSLSNFLFWGCSLLVLGIANWRKQQEARRHQVGQWNGSYNRKPPLGYQEKFYFNPGDTGFKVFQTKFAKIGVGKTIQLLCLSVGLIGPYYIDLSLWSCFKITDLPSFS
ncbi:hypothetical protein K1719_044495 [Acacia pycnantha]|nr:hypothetical protein K1719_044495 [Acacia pycnantha]